MFPPMLVPVVIVAISGFVLVRSHLERRALIVSMLFGLSGMLIVVACFFLWAIGGIAFHTTATLLAGGLTLLNLFIGSRVIRRLRRPELSPSQRDVPPPDEPHPG